MKNFHHLLALLCLLISCSYATAQWQITNGPTTLYAESIEQVNSQLWAGTRGGVYVSADEGLTWQRNSDFDGMMVSDILYNNHVLMVACLRKDNYPFIKTSFDNGITWSTSGQVICCVSYCPFMKLTGLGNAVLLNDGPNHIISYDYGATWQQIVHPYTQFPTSIITDGKTILAKYLNNQGNRCVTFLSHNAGLNWNFIDSLSLVYGEYIQDSTIILSRSHHNGFSWRTKLCRSANMGATWDTVYIIPDSSIVFDIVKYGPKLYASGTGGYFSSADNGLHWQPDVMPKNNFQDKVVLANGDELGSHQPEGIALYNYSNNTLTARTNGLYAQYIYALRSHNNTLWASTEETVHKSTDGGDTWQLANMPQTGITDFEFSGDTIIGITDNYLVTSVDNGNTWNYSVLYSFGSVPFKTIEYEDGKLYQGADSIRLSLDLGASWQVLRALPDTINPNTTQRKITGVIKLFEGRLYAVNENAMVFVYNENTQQWRQLFKAPPSIHNELYALNGALVMSGYNQLWVSYDEGVTWSEPAMQGLPPQSTPHNLTTTNGLWLGTCEEYGVYASSDSGNTWRPFYDGTCPFPASLRGGLTVLNNTLYAGADFRSVWKYNGAIAMPTAMGKTPAARVRVYPNPATDVLFIDFSEALSGTVTLYNVNGATVKKEAVAGNRTSLKISDLANGIYTGMLSSGSGQNSMFRFIINR
ncbi:MAG TPA: T9SS type A sorting domain-containing protein [Chitinophagales bacterium]|nr:T9SS type A sorting domain-containing protein [Chitinophagales bacterium]